MSFIAVYVTHPSNEEAKKICDILLNKKLIACYNLFPVENAYWWNGNIENSSETVSILKTAKWNWGKLKNEIKVIHSYKIPCIMKIEVEANEEYESWINETII
ncbi:MAG: periplasmic divalent cation tolerance protein (CutA) [uncultured bacterium (gcode 4)]|uniref:Periplasmic divalent cation tolerance protein (CutA) n=1 Tax=uncultured bacterium (gcode 4) TaxID=1234023 RepID=K2GUB8_9BACT|nr:MAG: periplasmic divalent cation tolerance protein (CutA) [uncultured bacterium (gcode 4)]